MGSPSTFFEPAIKSLSSVLNPASDGLENEKKYLNACIREQELIWELEKQWPNEDYREFPPRGFKILEIRPNGITVEVEGGDTLVDAEDPLCYTILGPKKIAIPFEESEPDKGAAHFRQVEKELLLHKSELTDGRANELRTLAIKVVLSRIFSENLANLPTARRTSSMFRKTAP
jgi:hypothetical protein